MRTGWLVGHGALTVRQQCQHTLIVVFTSVGYPPEDCAETGPAGAGWLPVAALMASVSCCSTLAAGELADEALRLTRGGASSCSMLGSGACRLAGVVLKAPGPCTCSYRAWTCSALQPLVSTHMRLSMLEGWHSHLDGSGLAWWPAPTGLRLHSMIGPAWCIQCILAALDACETWHLAGSWEEHHQPSLCKGFLKQHHGPVCQHDIRSLIARSHAEAMRHTGM